MKAERIRSPDELEAEDLVAHGPTGLVYEVVGVAQDASGPVAIVRRHLPIHPAGAFLWLRLVDDDP